ncbi:MAG: FKBP-type peptidyl-prolyl cis-trans isomerase [Bacteroidota bacterium]
MKKILIILVCAVSINIFAQTESEGTPQLELTNRTDSLNYFFGLTLGYSLETAPFQTDAALISEGMAQALKGISQHDPQSSKEIFQELHMALSQEEAAYAEDGANENLEKGNAFLLENGKREGVTTTQSGLQYEVISQGTGPVPDATSSVEVHYEGTLIDGTVFDSSYKRGESISFPLNRVITGWTEGVQLMKVGSTYRFYIPSNLAYGPRDSGPIPANSVLIFKIELLGIE